MANRCFGLKPPKAMFVRSKPGDLASRCRTECIGSDRLWPQRWFDRLSFQVRKLTGTVNRLKM